MLRWNNPDTKGSNASILKWLSVGNTMNATLRSYSTSHTLASNPSVHAGLGSWC